MLSNFCQLQCFGPSVLGRFNMWACYFPVKLTAAIVIQFLLRSAANWCKKNYLWAFSGSVIMFSACVAQ